MFDITSVLVEGQVYPVHTAIAPLIAMGALSLGSKLLGGIFGRKKKTNAQLQAANPYDKEFQTAVDQAKGRRNTLEGNYDASMGQATQGYQDVAGFTPGSYDAGAAYKEYAGGVMSDFNRTLGESVRKMKESGAGAGRLDTGMWEQDTGDVMTEAARGASSDLARQAISAAGITSASKTNADQMRLGALSTAAGGYGSLANNQLAASEGASNRYLDTLTGATNRQIQLTNAAEQAKASKRKGWMDFLGGAAKTALPYILKSKTLGA